MRRHWRSTGSRLVAVVVAVWAAPVSAQDSGWMVLGEYSAELFELPAGVALPEVDPPVVPEGLAQRVEAWADGRGYDPFCLRYFDGMSRVVVYAPSSCVDGGPAPDHSPVAAFDQSGDLVGGPISDYWDVALKIEPWFRFRRSPFGLLPLGSEGLTPLETFQAYWRAIQDNDAAEMRRLTDDRRGPLAWPDARRVVEPGFFWGSADCLEVSTTYDSQEPPGSVVVWFFVPVRGLPPNGEHQTAMLGTTFRGTTDGWRIQEISGELRSVPLRPKHRDGCEEQRPIR